MKDEEEEWRGRMKRKDEDLENQTWRDVIFVFSAFKAFNEVLKLWKQDLGLAGLARA